MPNARIRPGQTISRVPGEPPNKVNSEQFKRKPITSDQMKISTMDRDDQRENDDITDVANMAQIDLANEAENLNNASTVVGSEVKSAPGGDKAVSVNEQGIDNPSIAFCYSKFQYFTSSWGRQRAKPAVSSE